LISDATKIAHRVADLELLGAEMQAEHAPIRLDAEGLMIPPTCPARPDVAGEIVRIAVRGDDLLLGENLLDRRSLREGGGFPADPRDDLGRRLRRREDADPGRELESRQGFRDRGDIGQRGQAPGLPTASAVSLPP